MGARKRERERRPSLHSLLCGVSPPWRWRPSSFFFNHSQIRVLASLRHPHIVPLLAVYETPTHLLLVMERAHGGELFDRIVARGHFTEADAATVCASFWVFHALNSLARAFALSLSPRAPTRFF